MKVDKISYESLPVDVVQTFEGNPRRGDVARISESLRARGQYRPIVVNRGTHTGREFEVLAGNHTLLAARSIGWETIDCGVVDVDEQTARAIVLADNRLADLGTYDNDALADLLESLDDITGIGYSESDIDAILKERTPPEELTDPDEAPSVPDTPPISAPGDVFQLGPHRVWCGDSTDAAGVLDNLLYDGRADCVWTDPPYGVSYVGKTKESLTIQNDGAEGLAELLQGAMGTVVVASNEGVPVYVAHADTERLTFEMAMRDAGMRVRQNLIWVKNTLVLGRSDYHYKHEPILYGETPPANPPAEDGAPEEAAPVEGDGPGYSERHEPVLYGFTPGGKGRRGRGGESWFGDNSQTTVFDVAKPPRNSEHPTMKPVDLVMAMLKNSAPPPLALCSTCLVGLARR